MQVKYFLFTTFFISSLLLFSQKPYETLLWIEGKPALTRDELRTKLKEYNKERESSGFETFFRRFSENETLTEQSPEFKKFFDDLIKRKVLLYWYENNRNIAKPAKFYQSNEHDKTTIAVSYIFKDVQNNQDKQNELVATIKKELNVKENSDALARVQKGEA